MGEGGLEYRDRYKWVGLLDFGLSYGEGWGYGFLVWVRVPHLDVALATYSSHVHEWTHRFDDATNKSNYIPPLLCALNFRTSITRCQPTSISHDIHQEVPPSAASLSGNLAPFIPLRTPGLFFISTIHFHTVGYSSSISIPTLCVCRYQCKKAMSATVIRPNTSQPFEPGWRSCFSMMARTRRVSAT